MWCAVVGYLLRLCAAFITMLDFFPKGTMYWKGRSGKSMDFETAGGGTAGPDQRKRIEKN